MRTHTFFAGDVINEGTITNCGGSITDSAFLGPNQIVEGGSACAAAPPIPEYPLGLPILAILTIIGYGLVRRRTNLRQVRVASGAQSF